MKKRIFDITGAAIATLIAAAIISQFDSILNLFRWKFDLTLYMAILSLLLVIFITTITVRKILQRNFDAKLKQKKSKLEKLGETITKLQVEIVTLEESASIDLQTGAMNKNQKDRLLQRKIQQAEDTGEPFFLVLVDIDYFKRINDTHDHEIGNFILKQLAEKIEPRSNEDDFIRYGGDEFLIISKVGENISAGYGFAERIRKEVAEHKFILNYANIKRERLTISCGLTEYVPKIDKEEQALTRVANALKIAKSKKEDGSEKNFVHVVEKIST